MNTVDTDVIVVGAGYSGIAAARRLVAQGHTVRILEAAPRVGGRTLTHEGANGVPVDMGGQWIGREHTRMRELVAEFGGELVPTPKNGEGIIRDAEGGISPLSPTSLAAAGALGSLLLQANSKEGASDDVSVAEWLQSVHHERARHLIGGFFSTLLNTGPENVSLRTAALILGGPKQALAAIQGDAGAEDWVPAMGAGALVQAMADELGDRVLLGRRVLAVHRDAEGVTVETEKETLRARRLIIALAPPQSRSIRHDPPLPPARVAAEEQTFMGTVLKAVVIYDRPFWRDAGLSGSFAHLDDPVLATADISPEDGPGRMTVLIPAQGALDLGRMTPGERRARILRILSDAFGDEAMTPLSYEEKAWHEDEFVLGGYGARPYLGSGAAVGPEGFRPVGPVFWASTEAATEFNGYMEGAVRAGEKAAEDVAQSLTA